MVGALNVLEHLVPLQLEIDGLEAPQLGHPHFLGDPARARRSSQHKDGVAFQLGADLQ